MESHPSRPGLLERLSALLSREPESRNELLALLHAAYERNLVDADALTIIEGALQVSDMQVRDVAFDAGIRRSQPGQRLQAVSAAGAGRRKLNLSRGSASR